MGLPCLAPSPVGKIESGLTKYVLLRKYDGTNETSLSQRTTSLLRQMTALFCQVLCRGSL